MIIKIYRCWVDELSFEKTGAMVAEVEVPDGSSVERANGLWDFRECRMTAPCGPVLMVPSDDDPFVRYAWTAVDVVKYCMSPESRFSLVNVENSDRHAISVGVGCN